MGLKLNALLLCMGAFARLVSPIEWDPGCYLLMWLAALVKGMFVNNEEIVIGGGKKEPKNVWVPVVCAGPC